MYKRQVVNSLPVSHGFRIHPETLDEFLNDIKQGVPRLVGHESWGRVPIGRTFDGWLDWRKSLEDGTPYEVLYAKSYMPVSYTHLDVYKRQVLFYLRFRLYFSKFRF